MIANDYKETMKRINIKKDLQDTRAFLGHKVGKNLGKQGLHPSTTNFLLGNRQNIAIFNLNITLKHMVKSLLFLFSVIRKKGHILIINTNPEFSNLVINFTTKINNRGAHFSYCNAKWVGGTLTNWTQISKSILTFIKFSERFGFFILQNNIHFPKYKKLKKCFQGFTSENCDEFKAKDKKNILGSNTKPDIIKPDILIILNPNENRIVLNEAKQLKIPVIALTDTNTNLSLITYPVPVNNNSIFFVHFYFSWIVRLVNFLGDTKYN